VNFIFFITAMTCVFLAWLVGTKADTMTGSDWVKAAIGFLLGWFAFDLIKYLRKRRLRRQWAREDAARRVS
jgi:membrane associated rhomboid family serine protease